MEIGFKSHYFKKLADLEYGNFWFCARNELILWALTKYSSKFSDFLEIGCGTGFVISAISKKFPNVKSMGSEYFEEGLVYARRRVPTVDFIQMDARDIPYVSQFDAVGIFDVLEHIENDELVLQQIYKTLKPGGMLYITVPQHQWLWSPIDDYACHIRRYTEKDLLTKMNKLKFEIILSTSFVSFLLPAMYISRFFSKNNLSMDMKDISGLQLNPVLNKIFKLILNLELILIFCGVMFPLGGSRFLVARKPETL